MAIKVKARGNVLYIWGKYKGVDVRKSTGLALDKVHEAQVLASQAMAAIDGGAGVEPPAVEKSGVTFADAAEAYLREEPRSVGTQWYVRRMVEIMGDEELARVDRARVDLYMRQRYDPSGRGVTVEKATRNRERTVLKAVLRFSPKTGRTGSIKRPRSRWRAAARSRMLPPT